MITREDARLRALFHRLLLVSASATPIACSGSSGDAPDASFSPDAASSAQDAESAGDEGQSSASDDAARDAPSEGDAAPSWDGGSDDARSVPDGACDPQFIDGRDEGTGCNFFKSLPCGLPSGTQVESCRLLLTECASLCNQDAGNACDIVECVNQDAGPEASVPPGPVTLECTTGLPGCGPGPGRRPAALLEATPIRRGDAVGAWLASAAHLEAASVIAFKRLARELASMRAPRALVRAAERSARDEVRHARITTRLALRRGAAPAPVVVSDTPDTRSLEAFATENAVEGCVNECFAALLAGHQALHARDRDVAREMKRIARDEARHAALAWSVARWVAPRLDPQARQRVARATGQALARLRSCVSTVSSDVAGDLGLPTGDDAQRLFEGFAQALFPSPGSADLNS